MKAMLSFFLLLIFSTVSVLSQASSQFDDEENYCYKPSEPLLFSSVDYKKRYTEDLQEYLKCKQSFIEMQQRTTSLRNESEQNALRARERYESKRNID